MASKGGEQVKIFENDEIVVSDAFICILEYGNQIIVATAAARDEATRRAGQLKSTHPTTIKRQPEDLVPGILFDMFAQNWRPESQ